MHTAQGITYKSGKGRGVFLGVHGMAGSPKELEFLAKRLRDAGISSDVPTLPGHGTTMEDLERLRWQEWVDFLEERLLALGKDKEPVFVGGLCSGALLALAVALRQPSRIRGLVLYSTALFYDGWNLPKWGKLFLYAAFFTPIGWHKGFRTDRPPYGVKDKRLQGVIASMYARMDSKSQATTLGYTEIPAATFHEMHKLRNHVKRHLGEIHTPTLLLHSLEDDLTSVKSSKFVLERLGSSQKRLVLLEDCYHLITVDKKKREVADQTVSFLEELIQSNVTC